MVGKFKRSNKSKSYLVESFVLNSEERVVSRRGKGKSPDPAFRKNNDQVHQVALVAKHTGRKVRELDLETLTLYFNNYVEVINLLLKKIYINPSRAQQLGKNLSEFKGKTYSLLRKDKDLNYERNAIFREKMYERLFRNALEQAGRMLLADFTRRELFNAALEVLDASSDDVLVLLRRKRMPSALIRKVRDSCK
ncbi:unnamed protein product, partial [marine sediment metagenome]